MFNHTGFRDSILTRGFDHSYLNATGDSLGDTPSDAFRKALGLYVPYDQSLLQQQQALTTLSPDAKKDNTWLASALGIINSAVSGYFDSEAAKATGTLGQGDILNALQAYQTAQTQAQAEAKQKQTQTLIIGGIVLLVLAVGAYFVFRKK
ncbi:hypothetical protein [Spirosoma sp. 48-14]|uniref:hypothetical protein n=1 Tax=Spirosoma sp. 48-14 TaxID=1895854 RepID=UPI000967EA89|nr:hypothetical protein [Spirosoma sp. 48-14]OJW76308.1 MAG: hypothetical protein BGO59_22580 [Spirosoma sp. 48-14]